MPPRTQDPRACVGESTAALIHNIDNSKYAANKPVLVATNNMLITYLIRVEI